MKRELIYEGDIPDFVDKTTLLQLFQVLTKCELEPVDTPVQSDVLNTKEWPKVVYYSTNVEVEGETLPFIWATFEMDRDILDRMGLCDGILLPIPGEGTPQVFVDNYARRHKRKFKAEFQP